MREVDDRYPEFARPYEPVKGGKHYKRLSNSVLPLVAALLLGLCALVPGKPSPPPPGPVPVISPTPSDPVVPPVTPGPTDPPVTPGPTDPPVTPGPTDPPVTPGPTPYNPVPPRPNYKAPAFSSAAAEHIEEPSLDGTVGANYFQYYFNLKLNDADTSKGVKVTLQYGDANGGNWKNCPAGGHTVNTLTYKGSGKTWSANLDYDVLTIDLDALGEPGVLRQIRIVCNYTLKNGKTGTIYSTSTAKLYAYVGDYVSAGEIFEETTGLVTSDGLEAVFVYDPDLVLDTSKVELTQAYLRIGDRDLEIPTDKVTLSTPDDYGRFTITIPLSAFLNAGETLTPGDNDRIYVYFNYNDKNGAINWDSGADGRLLVTPVTAYEPPEFTGATGEHDFYDGDDGAPYDDFYYDFSLDLKDADTSQPITATLQYRGVNGGDWQTVPAGQCAPLTYSGTGATWDDYFQYDFLNVAIPAGETGIIREVRIACDYTLPDGSSGTVYSTDVGTLYAYKGEYLERRTANITNNVLTATFHVDTSLVLDTSKVEAVDLAMWSGTTRYDILGKATVSGPTSDGTITVTYTLNGETFPAGNANYVILACRYYDKGGAINWESVNSDDITIISTFTLPTFSYDPYGDVMDEETMDPWIRFEVTPNDLLGGTGTATLYFRTRTGSYAALTGENSISAYDGSDAWEDWLCCPLGDLPEFGGASGWVKIVIDYAMPGETAGRTWESGEIPVFKGNYIHTDTDFGTNGWQYDAVYNADDDSWTSTLTIGLYADGSLVDGSNVSLSSAQLVSEETWETDSRTPSISKSAGANGRTLIRVTYTFDHTLNAGTYDFFPDFLCTMDSQNSWRSDYYLIFTIA